MLSDAGSRLRLPRASLPGFKPFDVLSFSERQLLADEVRTILSWSADMRWPDIDQMRNVLRGLGG
jgi:hypothetical protein